VAAQMAGVIGLDNEQELEQKNEHQEAWPLAAGSELGYGT